MQSMDCILYSSVTCLVPEPYSARSASTTAKQMAHLRSNSYDQGDRTYHVLENPTNSSVGSGKSLQQMLDRAKVLPNNVSSSGDF